MEATSKSKKSKLFQTITLTESKRNTLLTRLLLQSWATDYDPNAAILSDFRCPPQLIQSQTSLTFQRRINRANSTLT